uniref:Uncharacterized protein n=1 Tax=Kalanchoe fedtschenkoi TaxID=63787 RepID=A0A7N0UZT9_KALFE
MRKGQSVLPQSSINGRRPKEVVVEVSFNAHNAFQRFNHNRHGRPPGNVILQAPRRQLHHFRSFLSVRHHVLATPVHQIHQPMHPFFRLRFVQVPPPGENLQHHDTEAVHVDLLRDHQAQPVRSQIAYRPSHARHHQPEVCNFRVEILVEQDVLGLDVQVRDLLPAFFMEVHQPFSDVRDNPLPASPVEAALRPENPLIQRPVRHVLVDQQSTMLLSAVPDEANQVDMMNASYEGKQEQLHL